MLLDPYDNAAELADFADRNRARLVLVLGAQAWCEKCRILYPQVISLASQDPDAAYVWLDVDDDAAFLGSYLPADLPEVQIYEGLSLTSIAHPGSGLLGLRETMQGAPVAGTCAPQPDDPGILARLLKPDWAR